MALTTKWDCPVCTYLNWSTSLKCTLCGCNKPVIPAMSKGNIGKVKLNTSLTVKQPTPSKSMDAIDTKRDRMKWTCNECTYANGSNVAQCTMCLTSRYNQPLSSSSSSSRKMSESIFDIASSPSLSGATPSIDHNGKSKVNKRHSPLHERRLSTATTGAGTTPAGSGMANNNRKWTCIACTYENWPRSIKCVMCNRPCSPSVVGAVGGGDSEEDVGEPMSPQITCRRTISSSLTPPTLHHSDSSSNLRQMRNKLKMVDKLFIDACRGIIKSDLSSVRSYIKHGGDRNRQLTHEEVLMLNKTSQFTVGSTLIHLAVRFHQSDILAYLLTPAPTEARKRLPSHTNPELADDIREQVAMSLSHHQGEWACRFITQLTTYILPKEVTDLSPSISQKLLDEIVDRDVQKELEEEAPIINWSNEITNSLHSRLYPLWNRTAGDCLLDSALQATWGVVDRDNTLRQTLSDSLSEGDSKFYERWKYTELLNAHKNGFNIEEDQLKSDWSNILSSADRKKQPLEQAHIFVLAHILRRPLIVYAVKVVKNFKGEQLGLANFEGIYLPLLWDSTFCWKVPIALGYTRGHFSALVGMEKPKTKGSHVTYLPLVDNELKQLPVHFLSEQEIDCYEELIKEYCDCHVTSEGVLTARQIVVTQDQPVEMIQLMNEWMNRFFRLNKRQEATCNDINVNT